MKLYESILLGLGILAPGSFWLGYTFLKHDAQWKLAMARGGRTEELAPREELEALRSEVAELRKELTALRDTSTSFDLSLEAALTELQSRSVR